MPATASSSASVIANMASLPLLGRECVLTGTGWPQDYAAALLASLGAWIERRAGAVSRHPAQAWADSGAMALTGAATGAALLCPLPLASCIEGVALALDALLTSAGRLAPPWPGVTTLAERAALLGLTRQGRHSAGGACRLLAAADGWLALSLPRLEDWALLPALLEGDCLLPERLEEASLAPAWQALQARLASHSVAQLVARAHLMGLAAAAVTPQALWQPLPPWQAAADSWLDGQALPTAAARDIHPGARPLVVDLSSLWAGPLCSHLLQRAGARVIKVESLQRPDGARWGGAAFFDLMHHGKQSVALDFASAHGRAQLQALLARADIVIEASRPRALRQLGIHAEQLLAARPGLCWISLSGYGRQSPQEDWIAYGDDAGVAAGLSALMLELGGEPLFCGDAIADPLTGWHAALAALAGWLGGGGLYALSLVAVVRQVARFGLPASPAAMQRRWQEWQCHGSEHALTAAPPRGRAAAGPARPLGSDTAAVLSELGIAC